MPTSPRGGRPKRGARVRNAVQEKRIKGRAMSSISTMQDCLPGVEDRVAYEDYAALLRTLLPNVRKICFFDSSSRICWMSDAVEIPEVTFQVTKLLLQATAAVCDSQTIENAIELTHLTAVRGPDDSIRGAIAIVMGRRAFGRKTSKLRSQDIAAVSAPLLRILGRALDSPSSIVTPPAVHAVAAPQNVNHAARRSQDPFVGAAARTSSTPVVMRRTLSNAIGAVSCTFGATIAIDRNHTLVQRGNEHKQALTDLRHIADSVREALAARMHACDDPAIFKSRDLARLGASDFKVLAHAVRKPDRQIAALLVLFRRRHERDFDAADRTCLRDIALRIPAHVIEELGPFPRDRSQSEAPAEVVKTHLQRTSVLESRDATVRAATSIDEQLRAALRSDGFDLHAQAIVSLRGESQKTRVEVLLRLRQEDSVQVPENFLQTAEQCQLLPEIDRWVVSRLFSAMRQHIDTIRSDQWEFAVNVSAASLQRESFGDFIDAQLFRSGVPPQALVFEFSEYDVLAQRPMFERLAHRLYDMGCRVAIDNCRQGVDLFLSIGRLPVHRLKIDAALTHHLTTDARAAHVVRELTEVARDVGIETVGERIEDEATCHMLRELGIDFAQGFTIGRPRPLSELFQ